MGKISINFIFYKYLNDTITISKADLDQFLSDIAIVRGRRQEEVTFDRYVEREIHPQVLGSGGDVNVSGGNITLPPPVTSPLPLPEDYAESSDAPITPEIQALAANLSYDPARIYWWIYKNIRYEPYYGAMHGAEQTLISRSGNDINPSELEPKPRRQIFMLFPVCNSFI